MVYFFVLVNLAGLEIDRSAEFSDSDDNGGSRSASRVRVLRLSEFVASQSIVCDGDRFEVEVRETV